MGRIIEGLWDCSYCGTTAIGGSKQSCSNCGRVRNKDTTFYLPGQKRYLSAEAARKVNKNPDWVCEYCDNLNSADDSSCVSCGSVRTSSSLDYFQNKAKRGESSASQNMPKHSVNLASSEYENFGYKGTYRPNVRATEEYRTPDRAKQEPKYESVFDESPVTFGERIGDFFRNIASINWAPFICFILVAALIAGVVYLFIPKEQELTITDIRWERNIDIQEYRTVNESDWSVPTGGRVQYTNREIHHYEDVFDHYVTKSRQVPKERYVRTETVVTGYRDLGNGHFEEITSSRDIYETYYETEFYQEAVYRSEPVYRTKYYYEIERWIYDRTATAKAADKNPKWPVLNLAENERESSRKETYTVTGKDDEGKEFTFTLSYEDWKRVHLGQEITVKLSFGHGEIISVDENFVVYEEE